MIFDTHLKIGCELHSIKKWHNFDSDTIQKMDREVLVFWEKSKEFILNFCKANGRG